MEIKFTVQKTTDGEREIRVTGPGSAELDEIRKLVEDQKGRVGHSNPPRHDENIIVGSLLATLWAFDWSHPNVRWVRTEQPELVIRHN